MVRKKNNITSRNLAMAVIEGIQEKKGIEIVLMDLSKIRNSICDYFVVCHGTSRTHVEAIADGLRDYVQKKHSAKPWHSEGFENAEWILIDFVDVVVHIFQPHTRTYYKLEDLWADAELTQYNAVE